jgi:hypothetical protein
MGAPVRSRKKEIESVVALLDQEHESVEDLAEAVWKLVDVQRRERDGWVIFVNHGHPLYMVYGVFDTENAALKELGKMKSTTGNEKVFVFRLAHASKVFDDVLNYSK